MLTFILTCISLAICVWLGFAAIQFVFMLIGLAICGIGALASFIVNLFTGKGK